MLRFFSKRFWIVHLAFIACLAWLGSYLTVVIIQDRISAIPPAPARKPAAKLALAPEPYEKYSPVTELNIFNPAERGAKLIPLEKKTAGGPDGREAPPPGSLVLAGTITGPEGHSWAILQDRASRKQEIYRIHGRIEGARILSISRKQIEIEGPGGKETLSISPEALAAKGPAAPGVPVSPAAVPQPSRGGEQVRKLAPNRFLVNREDVNAAVGDINKFMTQGRLKPHFEAGRPSGYSVSEIVPGSLFEKLGLRNNDVIKKVNGMPISQPEEIMQAYAQLQKDANIEIEVDRSGRSETLRYEIR